MTTDSPLKLIQLNIWGGKVYQPLIDFLKSHSDVDIFCFQEVFNKAKTARPITEGFKLDIFDRISEVLSEHVGMYCSEQDDDEGIALFIKKDLKIIQSGELFVHRWRNAMEQNGGTLGRVLQWSEVVRGSHKYTVSHFHGLWNGGGKGDSADRIEQSNKVKAFLNSVDGPKILCGDFNLLPNTNSMAILNEGMQNLVQKFEVTNTRSSLYTKAERFADYVLVSPDVEVVDFKVLPDTISDHLALFLEFK